MNQLSESRVANDRLHSDVNEDFVTIPGLAGGAVGTKYDWNTTYAPSDALNGRSVSIPQGKVVGGSTKLNRMVFDRGSKSDYNRWEALGNQGWGWDSLFPYFKKVRSLYYRVIRLVLTGHYLTERNFYTS